MLNFANIAGPFLPIAFQDLPLTEKEYLTLAGGVEPFDGKFAIIGDDEWIYVYYRAGAGEVANKVKFLLGNDGLYHIAEFYVTPHFQDNMLLEAMYDSYHSPYVRFVAIREFQHTPKLIYHPQEKCDPDTRYALYQNGGQRTLYIIGLNPSSACKTEDDPTMRKVLGFIQHNGYDGYVMLNVYPQRNAKPKNLHPTCDLALHQRNLAAIQDLLRNEKHAEVLFAFGNGITKRDYLLPCLKDIYELFKPHLAYLARPVTLQIGEPTKKGCPRHPLYEKYDVFCHFDVDAFLHTHGL